MYRLQNCSSFTLAPFSNDALPSPGNTGRAAPASRSLSSLFPCVSFKSRVEDTRQGGRDAVVCVPPPDIPGRLACRCAARRGRKVMMLSPGWFSRVAPGRLRHTLLLLLASGSRYCFVLFSVTALLFSWVD